MPIIVDRKTGEIISMPEISEEQRQLAWEIIVREWCKRYLAESTNMAQETEKKE